MGQKAFTKVEIGYKELISKNADPYLKWHQQVKVPIVKEATQTQVSIYESNSSRSILRYKY